MILGKTLNDLLESDGQKRSKDDNEKYMIEYGGNIITLGEFLDKHMLIKETDNELERN